MERRIQRQDLWRPVTTLSPPFLASSPATDGPRPKWDAASATNAPNCHNCRKQAIALRMPLKFPVRSTEVRRRQKKKPEPRGFGSRELTSLSSYDDYCDSQLDVNVSEGGSCPEPSNQSPYQTGRLWTRRDSNLRCLRGVRSRARNPEHREGPPGHGTG